jgi:hypothetical protein
MTSNTTWPRPEPESIWRPIHQFTSKFSPKRRNPAPQVIQFLWEMKSVASTRLLYIVPVYPATASINFSPWGYRPLKANIFSASSSSLFVARANRNTSTRIAFIRGRQDEVSYHLGCFEINPHSFPRPIKPV